MGLHTNNIVLRNISVWLWKNSIPEDVIIKPDQYPLTKEIVVEAFEKVDLPGIVSEERYDSAIRTSIDIRDEENRLIAGIASNISVMGCHTGNNRSSDSGIP